jgi:uncharacterized Zn finger protein (UPF0148 family)
MGAGVGALSSGLVFELGVCPECGSRLVESNGLLVCESCGLVAAPVYAPPKLDPAYAPIAASPNPARGFYERVIEAAAAELGLPAKAALELYKRLKALAKPEEAAAVALFVTAKRSGAYVSLARVCELLSRCGVKASYSRARRALLACGALIRRARSSTRPASFNSFTMIRVQLYWAQYLPPASHRCTSELLTTSAAPLPCAGGTKVAPPR